MRTTHIIAAVISALLVGSLTVAAPRIDIPGVRTVADEGTPLTFRSTLNFEGAGVTCADDTTQTTCTIPGGGGASPLTTKGDLYTFTTVDARLPVGTDGLCLIANSADPTGLNWATCAAPGSGISYAEASAATLAGF